jgi:hypothetical protein
VLLLTAIGEGTDGEGLLAEILATLDETDPESFRPVLKRYSPWQIQTALKRVRETPPKKLRKSRTALFRFLLPRIK